MSQPTPTITAPVVDQYAGKKVVRRYAVGVEGHDGPVEVNLRYTFDDAMSLDRNAGAAHAEAARLALRLVERSTGIRPGPLDITSVECVAESLRNDRRRRSEGRR